MDKRGRIAIEEKMHAASASAWVIYFRSTSIESQLEVELHPVYFIRNAVYEDDFG